MVFVGGLLEFPLRFSSRVHGRYVSRCGDADSRTRAERAPGTTTTSPRKREGQRQDGALEYHARCSYLLLVHSKLPSGD